MRASRAVTPYIEFIAGEKPKQRKNARTVESEVAKIDQRLASPQTPAMKRLHLMQDRHDLITKGHLPGQLSQEETLREAFIANAKTYSQLHGICYEVFLDFGISAEVLARAGLKPTGSETADPGAAGPAGAGAPA